MPLRTLYLCYFGLREPLVQTQVLPYLRQLVRRGIDVSLLTFEPQLRERWTEDELAGEKSRLEEEGIRWSYLPYHKRPSVPATLYDIAAGARLAVQLARRDHIEVLHARAHVPLAMALLARLRTRCRLIFDIRGLMAEEYADAGIWTERSLPFRMVKRLERAGIRRADRLVVLTHRLREWLIERGLAKAEKIHVVPCCVDLSRFDEETNASGEALPPQRFEVVYAGSVTGLYLLEEMVRFFMEIRARVPRAFLRILTAAPRDEAEARLLRAGLSAGDFWVGAARPEEVPRYMRRARLGLSFRKPTFSQIASSPTKVPEYLAAGTIAISNAGIGDMDDLLETERVGVIVRQFTREAYAEAAERALALVSDPGVRERCMSVARKYFDLEQVGGVGYADVYRDILRRAE